MNVGSYIRLPAALVLTAVSATLALAQSGGGYDLHWNVPASGGGPMSGANGYTLIGTVGQTAASPAAITTCAKYAVHSGFWAGIQLSNEIFCSGFE